MVQGAAALDHLSVNTSYTKEVIPVYLFVTVEGSFRGGNLAIFLAKQWNSYAQCVSIPSSPRTALFTGVYYRQC